MRSRLDQIEHRLQAFIESSLYFLPADQKQDALARQLVAAIEQTVVREANGAFIAPNFYTVRIHPDNLRIWESRPGLVEALSRVLNEASREAGLQFPSVPVLLLQGDLTQAKNQFSISASTRTVSVEETAVVPVQDDKAGGEAKSPLAFLILNGSTTLPLSMAVLNIGRRPDNQIVIDDPRVSRTHAQLRAVRGHYVLFDLNSTGGTYINGIRISQQILKPGDVISLSGVPLIYGEENIPPAAGTTHEFSTGKLDLHLDPPHH